MVEVFLIFYFQVSFHIQKKEEFKNKEIEGYLPSSSRTFSRVNINYLFDFWLSSALIVNVNMSSLNSESLTAVIYRFRK